ncbi:DUF3919 family protein [Paenibacillus motobuensis]|uniref:DUF3919 family protein n=1 Tax=Paenibacillus TaxID=44249 RepID=UPI002040A66D|nr:MULTISPECIES: DUF3919 family protein [Paenibacillus]MCM3040687.1 DUF3919 family protein [Paenibacillus lutimineralis]MCM3647791.1 DUF3919 family protein [Paenibacillus motobuensis]
MPEDKKGLSWFRLILFQVIIGCLIIGICAYSFRIPVDVVQIVPPQQDQFERISGVPMRVDITYPGLGTVSIEDPKELLKLKSSFSGLLSAGKQRTQTQTPRLLLTGRMTYLDQEDIPFQVETGAFQFGDELVNSLDVSAGIRKLQSTLIDKILTTAMIGSAVQNGKNDVFTLDAGKLMLLSQAERNDLAAQITASTRIIDFSHFTDLQQPPDAHFVIQLSSGEQTKKHWIHLDRYNSAYFVVYDLLDETNQRAYFKLNETSY